jgi:hypothetical protein
MARPYPLEVARTVRSHAQSSAELGLRDARARLADATAKLEGLQRIAAELARARDESLRSAGSSKTAQVSESIGVSGAALARAGAWTARLHDRERAHRRLVEQAHSELRSQQRAVRLAELTLNQAYIEREVIERHHARFAQTERKRTERAQEAESDDLLQHAHSRSKI